VQCVGKCTDFWKPLVANSRLRAALGAAAGLEWCGAGMGPRSWLRVQGLFTRSWRTRRAGWMETAFKTNSAAVTSPGTPSWARVP